MVKIYGHTPNALFKSYNSARAGTALPVYSKDLDLTQNPMKMIGKFDDI